MDGDRNINPGRSPHLPSAAQIASWPEPSKSEPLRIVVSGCLAGLKVGYDGTSYGEHLEIARLIAHPLVRAFPFCPEDMALGTPRPLCDLQGGDGHDVLAGRARVIAATGEDVTQQLIATARLMLEYARDNKVQVALLMDISAACGSQVIYDGPRPHSPYRAGHGVCTALLVENGLPVLSQRDLATLSLIWAKLRTPAPTDGPRYDHHESEWYQDYFIGRSD
jgi:uncharacterized protein YbbK (DUF523 family)